MAAKKGPTRPDPGPRARELARRFRVDIISKCQPGERLPSEVQLTARFRCSNRTVRAALDILAAEKLIVRRQGSGTYVAERMGHVTGTTGVMMFGDAARHMLLPYVWEEFHGILAEASGPARQVQILTGFRPRDLVADEDLGRKVDLSQIDSLICIEVSNQGLLASLAKRMPVISVDAECYQPGVSSCFVDHNQSIDLAVEHLLRLGHRRIAMVGNLDPRSRDVAVQARRRAFSQALVSRGMLERPEWVIPILSADDSVRLIRKWQAEPQDQRPTAMISVNFEWPIAQAAVSAGVNVPQDLSLLCVGNATSWQSRVEHMEARETWLQTPDLRRRTVDVELSRTGQRTSPLEPRFAPLRDMVYALVKLPFRTMGRWAMRELIERLHQAGREPRHESFPGVFRPGNTAAPPPPV